MAAAFAVPPAMEHGTLVFVVLAITGEGAVITVDAVAVQTSPEAPTNAAVTV